MNKKAQFISFLAVFLILVFSTLAYAMYKHNQYLENINLNVESATTFKIYGLAEKNKYYLEQSAELSKQKALAEVEKNAGYLQSECSTNIALGNLVVWNSCPELNPNEKFKTIFEKELKEYIENQDQSYEKTRYETTLNKDDIKKIKPRINIVNDNIDVDFDDISYVVDYKDTSDEKTSFSIKYTFKPSFSIPAPDFSIYYQLCDALVSCNLGSHITQTEIDSCRDSLNAIKDVKAVINSQMMEISYGNLNFLVNLKSTLKCKSSLITH